MSTRLSQIQGLTSESAYDRKKRKIQLLTHSRRFHSEDQHEEVIVSTGKVGLSLHGAPCGRKQIGPSNGASVVK